jgi:hypothetical protein
LTSCGLGKRAKPEAEAPLPIVELPAVDWGRAGSGDRPRVVPELGRALPAGDFVVRIEVNRASAGPPLPRLAIFQIVRSSRSGKTTLASAILKLQDGPSSGPARYEGVCRNRTRKPGAVIIEVLLDRQPLLVRRSAVRPAN